MRWVILAAATTALVACSSPERNELAEVKVISASFDGSQAPTIGERVKHGERISRALGCHGCHGESLVGQKWDDDPTEYGVSWASNLTRSVPTMSDNQLDDLLRKGVHPARAEMWVMPSENFQHLSDADVAGLIAYLRSLKPVGTLSPPPILGPKAKEEIASGEIKPAHDLVRDPVNALPPDLGAATAQGRYIASVTCAECHGGQLAGKPGDTPDLVVATAYSREEFERLMTTGVPTGGRKLRLMSTVARSRFSKLTRSERDAVYGYLKARAEQPQ
jgi:mono/diheme cytochrome c family protein